MSRRDFYKRVAQILRAEAINSGLVPTVTIDDVDYIMSGVRKAVLEGVRDCDECKLFPGISIYGKRVPARKGVDPRDGTPLIIPEHIATRMKVTPKFREEVKNNNNDGEE